jgi:hypothetical protein
VGWDTKEGSPLKREQYQKIQQPMITEDIKEVNMKCSSIYYGQLKDWYCKKEGGHKGCHSADMDVRGRAARLVDPFVTIPDDGANYVTWTDEDEEYTRNHKFTEKLGGK